MASEPLQEKKKKGFDDWEKESFARSLMEAEEIKADPKKLAAAKEIINKKAAAATRVKMSLEDLKSMAADLEIEDNETIAVADVAHEKAEEKAEKKDKKKKES